MHETPPTSPGFAKLYCDLLAAQAQRSKKEEISHHSLDASLSSKIPFVDDIADAVESVSGSGLSVGDLESAFDRVSDVNKVQFVQNTVIDTVQKATTVLTRKP